MTNHRLVCYHFLFLYMRIQNQCRQLVTPGSRARARPAPGGGRRRGARPALLRPGRSGRAPCRATAGPWPEGSAATRSAAPLAATRAPHSPTLTVDAPQITEMHPQIGSERLSIGRRQQGSTRFGSVSTAREAVRFGSVFNWEILCGSVRFLMLEKLDGCRCVSPMYVYIYIYIHTYAYIYIYIYIIVMCSFIRESVHRLPTSLLSQ